VFWVIALSVQEFDKGRGPAGFPADREPWNPDTMTHRYRRYADRVGIRSSLKELRHHSATQLLYVGVGLTTVAARLGHAEGSTTLKFFYSLSPWPTSAPLPSSRPSCERSSGNNGSPSCCAAARYPPPPMPSATLAATLAPQAGLDQETALAWLAELAAARSQPSADARC
jgi:hypothetical protein